MGVGALDGRGLEGTQPFPKSTGAWTTAPSSSSGEKPQPGWADCSSAASVPAAGPGARGCKQVLRGRKSGLSEERRPGLLVTPCPNWSALRTGGRCADCYPTYPAVLAARAGPLHNPLKSGFC